MKKLLFSFLLLTTALSLSAQSYQKLWKQVDEAAEQDLPKTAMACLDRIYAKALSEKNDEQLLRALLVRRGYADDLSPDSGRVALRRLQTVLDGERRSVQRALLLSALGHLYRQQGDTASVRRGEAYLVASVADKSALAAARTKDYLSLFAQGKDSRYFDHDLLSVLLAAAIELVDDTTACRKLWHDGIDFYRKKGNRNAALLLLIDSIAEQADAEEAAKRAEAFRALRDLAQAYESLPLNVRTYCALVQFADRQDTPGVSDSLLVALAQRGVELYGKDPKANDLHTYLALALLPEMSLSMPATLYPGKTYPLVVRTKGVTEGVVKIARLHAARAEDLRNLTTDEIMKLPQTPVATVPFRVPARPAYAFGEDTLRLAAPAVGIYVAELTDGKGESDTELFYVSRLKALCFSAERQNNRIILVDSESGAPFLQTELAAYRISEEGQRRRFASDGEGFLYLDDDAQTSDDCYARAGDDAFLPPFSFSDLRRFRQGRSEGQEWKVQLFTDRGIYRPGQEVKLGGFVYTRHGDNSEVCPNYQLVVSFIDSNGKEIESRRLLTDAHGGFGDTFTLPTQCRPGRFQFRSGSYVYAFQVQEYKRPTFTAELNRPAVAYAAGDTVRLAGSAKTYTALPVPDAKVAYTVRRYEYRKWYQQSVNVVATGETSTDDEGRFAVPVALEAPDDRWGYAYAVSAAITAGNGETQEANQWMYLSKNALWLTHNVSGTICRERAAKWSVRLLNLSREVVVARGTYRIERAGTVVAEGHFESGVPFRPEALQTLASGRYRLLLQTEAPAARDTASFLLYSEHDTRPVADDVCWADGRISANRDSAFVLIGSPLRDVTLFYDLFANGRVMESRRVVFSDSLLRFEIPYRPSYGDGARATFLFVRGGEVYRYEITVEKPAPDKRLLLRWTSFRDRSQPGSRETWRLSVHRPDGTPAQASLLACLYDASLDRLAQNDWYFHLPFYRWISYSYWQSNWSSSLQLGCYYERRSFDDYNWELTRWRDELFAAADYSPYALSAVRIRGTRVLEEKSPMAAGGVMMESAAMEAAAAPTVSQEEAAADKAASVEAPASSSPLRSNFAETAFFHPLLRTDARGEVTLQFTLPESLTSWNVRTFAYDRSVDYGQLDTTLVVRKEFMVQPALPRFVREGDVTELPATLRNLGAKKASGVVVCRFLDAATDRVLLSQQQSFGVLPNAAQTLFFTLDTRAPELAALRSGALKVVIMAEGKTFADGEENYLPVLSARERIVRTVPFSLDRAGTLALRLDTLWAASATDRRLTVETASRPLWYVAAALPVLANQSCFNAVAWAERLYALGVAHKIAADHPELRRLTAGEAKGWAAVLNRNEDLKQTLLCETPWVVDGDTEAERVAALAEVFNAETYAYKWQTAFDRLRAMQRADGSWSWFPGLPASPWMTTEIARLLVRMQHLMGNTSTAGVLTRALTYLDGFAARQVEEMKKHDVQSCSDLLLRYLYVRALAGRSSTADVRYLVQAVEEQAPRQTMYMKALSALVLARYGKSAAARTTLQSLAEHLVTSPEMGTYFDTRRAGYSWRSYRIPTQTAALEAMETLQDKRTMGYDDATLRGMRLWLLQMKRTQLWETNAETTDAIYALLNDSASLGDAPRPLTFTLRDARGGIAGFDDRTAVKGSQTVGYARETFTDAAAVAATELRLTKSEGGLSWGSVYAQQSVPVTEVSAAGNGLTVTRRFDVQRGTTWEPLTENTSLRPGDVVRMVFTMTADRDYDFVSLKASRAACMEPIRPLSGYRWTEAGACYRVVRDAATEYFIEQLRKGTATFTDEFRIDRYGRFESGLVRLQSIYAPEFTGVAGSRSIVVKNE